MTGRDNLDIRIDQSNHQKISVSTAQNTVKLEAPTPETAQSIIDGYNTIVNLNQDIADSNCTERLHVFRDIACAYGAEVIQDVDGLPGLQKSRVTYIKLPVTDNSVTQHPPGSVTWTHIERPNRGTIEWAARQAGVDADSLAHYLENPDSGFSPRANTVLITRAYELPKAQEIQGFGKVSPTSCTIICGDGFIITLSRESSEEINRLWNDVVNKRTNPDELLSSSDIARAIIGAAAQHYQDGVEKLGKQISLFWKEHGSSIPSPKLLNITQKMRQDLEVSGRFARRIDDSLDAINRREQLAGRRIDNILSGSISNTIREISRTITDCEGLIKHGEAGWDSLNEQWRNKILFKLAALSGMTIPVGVWAGIGGMNFSVPLPDSVLWTGLATSAVISSILINKLLSGKKEFNRLFSNSPNKVSDAQGSE